MSKSLARDKSYDFALRVMTLVRRLREMRESTLANQVLRSGTSIGANIEEALAAHSRRDFIHKMAVASKEAREPRYWLRLLHDSGLLSSHEVRPVITSADELLRMLTAIVKTSQQPKLSATKN